MAVVASADLSDRRLAVRLGGGLALATAVLGAVQTRIQPPPAEARAVIGALIGVYAALGIVSLIRPRSIPQTLVGLSVAGGTLAIAGGMLASGLSAVDRTDNEMLFLIPVVYAAYFLERRWSLVVVLLAMGSYGSVLARLGAAGAGSRWLTTATALAVVTGVVDALRSREAERFDEVQDQAVSDPLTGLANRRALEQVGPALLAGSSSSSLLLLDVDRFKLINDTFGHDVGDEVLVWAARVLGARPSAAELAVRLGGDEFVLLLPGCLPHIATEVAEAVRQQVNAATTRLGACVTVSVGVAGCAGGATLSELLHGADAALYRAKRAGRNAVRFVWVDKPAVPFAPPDAATYPTLLPITTPGDPGAARLTVR